jgi:uncharacterized protein YdeI (YjbR/CyaY-like superfamily)
MSAEPIFFESPSEFRRWLRVNARRTELLWVGFHKVSSGRASMTWSESVDEALCFGWIDGLRKSIDQHRTMIRFTPRRAGSVWSSVNIERARSLIRRKLMRPAGLASFEARRQNRSGIYSYEQRALALPQPYAGELRKNRAASKFFQSQPPSYRKAAIWWVVSAKREATRGRRIRQLVADSERRQQIKQFERRSTAKAAAGT